ncbi:hypothetical protein TIFTF001_025722 [Ficus carica]|uniref:WRKY domain-containing protein n=1 Tax=Ficus carica TaxID=3494 RepID=A0AA88AP76_FICCA|nr:hypothetical protein TIFTF001_025722 [Ficus carica]
MESYQMFLLGSPQATSAVETDHMSNNAAHLFAHFHGINNTVGDGHNLESNHNKYADDHENEGPNLESNHNKYADDHESGGPSYRTTSEKNMTKSGKKQGNQKARRHKFAFQTRSQVDVLDDGYRWRKYGQKTVKNSIFPRLVPPISLS